MSIRIIIAEDNDVLREDLCSELSREAELEVVASVASGAAAVQAALQMEFDVILLDIEMDSSQAGIDAAAQIHVQKPQAKIMYLTAHDSDDMILTAMATGAVDFFVKGNPNKWLLRHIRMAAAGTPIMSEHAQAVMLQEYSRLRKSEESMLFFVHTLSLLTPTERELVRYLLQGLNLRQISEVRMVSKDTVKSQIRSIREKFGCAHTKEIVAQIRTLGLEHLFR